MLLYRLIFRCLLAARVDGETAHRWAGRALRLTMAIPGARMLIERALAPRDPRLRVQALGLLFPSPLGLAAGVDSNATWFPGMAALGFGFVEVGTVTARAQRGNDGARAVAERLRRRPHGAIVGVNVGKSRDVPLERAEEDYRASVRELAPLADYLALNVSSPNTPGL